MQCWFEQKASGVKRQGCERKNAKRRKAYLSVVVLWFIYYALCLFVSFGKESL